MALIHRLPPRRDAGFSLIELVMLLVVMGVLAVVASPLFEYRAFEQRGFYDEVSWAARYARTLAVTSGCEVQLSVSSNAYVLNQRATVLNQRATDCPTGAFTRDVRHPGTGDAMSAVAPAEVTLSMTNNPVVFKALGNTTDLLGQPLDRTKVTVGLTAGPRSFTIFGATGFVQEVP